MLTDLGIGQLHERFRSREIAPTDVARARYEPTAP